MPEFEVNRRAELEQYRELFGQGIVDTLSILTTNQDSEIPIDPFSLRLIDNSTVFTREQQIIFRQTLYSLVGRPLSEAPPPITVYSIRDARGENVSINVFEATFEQPDTGEIVPLYLHELISEQGIYSFVMSKNQTESTLLVDNPLYRPPESFEHSEMLDDPIIKAAEPTLEYSLSIVNELKKMFPEYLGITQDMFKKNGRICLYKETPNEEGKLIAINLLVSPTRFGYILGYVEEKGKKLVFNYKNLPRLVETHTSKGIQIDHPQTDWEFEANSHEARIRAFNEMEGILLLLKEHGEF